MAKTIITSRDDRGKVVFHSEEPRIMTQAEIKKECVKWHVDPTKIEVIYKD